MPCALSFPGTPGWLVTLYPGPFSLKNFLILFLSPTTILLSTVPADLPSLPPFSYRPSTSYSLAGSPLPSHLHPGGAATSRGRQMSSRDEGRQAERLSGRRVGPLGWGKGPHPPAPRTRLSKCSPVFCTRGCPPTPPFFPMLCQGEL